MKKIQDAKKEYNEIEIPSELGERVALAIEESRKKKKSGFGFYAKFLAAPVAVCAIICIAIGVGAMPDAVPAEMSDEESSISLARALPEAPSADGAEATSATDVAMDAEDSSYLSYDEYILSSADEGILPIKAPIQMLFSSGAAAWGDTLTLNADGTFEGSLHDWDADVGEDYPNGTVYACSYSGKFENIKKIDEHTYSMTLASLEYDESKPLEYIEDGFRKVKSYPRGIGDGKEFVFYLPDAPVSVLTEDERVWWHYEYIMGENGALGACGLVNKNEGLGFFSSPFGER